MTPQENQGKWIDTNIFPINFLLEQIFNILEH